jgi:integrase/recombinase XerD
MTLLAPILQAFFTTRLASQYGASTHTIAAYRDTWRLLLRYAAETTGTAPAALDLSQLDTDLITGFLTHLETERGNSTTTRNARLAAVHSLFSYAAYHHPEHAATISRVLAIPAKRAHRTDITYLDPSEVTALLAAPDRSTVAGRRDHALIQVAVTTGMRVSELTGLKLTDVHLGTAPHVVCHGKGRKDRITPLDRQTVRVLRELTAKASTAETFVFPTRAGTQMSRDAVAARLARHTAAAAQGLPEHDTQERDRPRPTAHRSHAAPGRRHRQQRHRALARPREHRNHPDLPARQHENQRRRPRQNQAHRDQTGTLQGRRRRPPSLPPRPLNYADLTARITLPTRHNVTTSA